MAKKSEQEHSLVISAVDKTKATFKSVQSSLGEIQGSINGVKGKLGALGIALSTASFSSMVKSAIAATAQLKKFQMQTGLSAEAITGLNYATGGNLDSVARAMGHLAKSAFDARAGGSEAKKVFSELGITFQQSNGKLKTAEQLFADTAGAIARLPNEMERSALAQKIFGKAYEEVLPLLLKGQNVFGVLAEEARKYGVVLSQDVIDSSSKFMKETQKISRVLDSGSKIWAAKLAPGLAIIASAIQNTIQAESDLQAKGKAFAKDGALENWAATTLTMIVGLIDGVDILKRAFLAVGTIIGNMVGGYVAIVSGIVRTLADVGDGLTKLLKRDFSGAAASFKKAVTEVGSIASDYKLFYSKTADDMVDIFNAPRMSESIRKFGDKALAEHKAAIDKESRLKTGVLSEQEKFSNKMVELQREMAKGMVSSIATQIEAIDKLDKKLAEARTKQQSIKDDFTKARDELKYGAVQDSSSNARKQIEDVLKAAEAAERDGKHDFAQSEARKVIGLLDEAKKERINDSAAFDKLSKTKTRDDPEWLAAYWKKTGSVSQTESEGYLDRAEGITQKAADKNVKDLETQLKSANEVLDGMKAKLDRLSTLEVSFDQQKALSGVESMMKLLQASIDKNPLVITAVNAKVQTDAQKKAAELTPYLLQPSAEPTLPDPGTSSTKVPATDKAVAPKQPMTIVLPSTGETWQVEGTAEEASSMNKTMQREKLKAGQ